MQKHYRCPTALLRQPVKLEQTLPKDLGPFWSLISEQQALKNLGGRGSDFSIIRPNGGEECRPTATTKKIENEGCFPVVSHA